MDRIDPDPSRWGVRSEGKKHVRTQRTLTSKEGIMIVAESNLTDHWWILT